MKKWMMSALTALVFLAGLCLVACGGTTSWQVTFDADGGTAVTAQSVEDGGTATEPATPKRRALPLTDGSKKALTSLLTFPLPSPAISP